MEANSHINVVLKNSTFLKSPLEILQQIVEGKLPLLDVRTKEEFSKVHVIGSSSLPWSELDARLYELPPKGSHLCVVVPDDMQENIKHYLEARGYPTLAMFSDSSEIWKTAESNSLLENGDESRRLWKPCTFLEEVSLEQLHPLKKEGHRHDRNAPKQRECIPESSN